jgi:phenylacetate-CoA ligase
MRVLGAPIASNYSSQELGYLALQCPECAQYHVQSESVFVEVLDENGAPCSAGESGRVVVTDLHNFAMPLIRYVIGDYAEVGMPCSAGRGLPSLRRVLGRRRNMVVFPDGRRHWPMTGFARFNDVAHIRQYQFVQHTPERIEVRLVVADRLSPDQLVQLKRIIDEAMGYSFDLEFVQSHELLPLSRGGKFEEFLCKF